MDEQVGGVDGVRAVPSAAEQLAELQLLTRADHHDGHERENSPLALDIHIDEDSMAVVDPDNSDEISIESSGSSSFSALLAASRRLAGTGSSVSSPLTSPTANSIDSPRHAQASSESRARRPTTMPSLCEEDADESSTEDGPESPADSSENDGRVAVETERGHRLNRPASRKISVGSIETDRSDVRDEDDINENFAFEDMIHRLPYDLSFLALSVADLTPRNLLRVRDALARSETPAQHDDLMDAKPPLRKMRLVRTMMAVDTLRLFLLRCDEDEVLRAVTDAVRKIYAQYVDDHGVGPLSHMQGVLTSSNITRVVLLVRDMLQKHGQQRFHGSSYGDNNRFEYSAKSPGKLRAGGRSSPTKSTSSTSPSSWRSRRSASSSSPSKALSPRPSSSSSPGRTSSDTSSPRRACSIFASEGIHVLMNEKLTAFQHRGDVNRLASFKVRRDSAVHAEEAARRRQRSIQYASETARALRG